MKLKFVLGMLSALFVLNNSYARNEFYLKPYVGAGISNITGDAGERSYLKMMGRDYDTKLQSIYTFSAGVEMGYQVNKLRVSTGVQYLQTGNQNNDVLLIFEGQPPVRDSGSISLRFSHLLVPVNIGYEISISKKFSITPQTGFAVSYNMKRVDDWNTNLDKEKTRINQGTFTNLYQPISVFSITSFNLEYSLVKKLRLFVAPTFYYMLTNMDVVRNPAFKTTEHPYALHLSAGCYVGL
ncbi:MAG: hypothetical protein BGO70_01805 [Bacteroidetes bacterium 43-93]|nr:outer membrane beta-barrel protein [Bacteroidota bacterium]OJW96442.1 MAG: hypothetical protein BGO70_01805 [Bacteroidetes bacterium 43-93]